MGACQAERTDCEDSGEEDGTALREIKEGKWYIGVNGPRSERQEDLGGLYPNSNGNPLKNEKGRLAC